MQIIRARDGGYRLRPFLHLGEGGREDPPLRPPPTPPSAPLRAAVLPSLHRHPPLCSPDSCSMSLNLLVGGMAVYLMP